MTISAKQCSDCKHWRLNRFDEYGKCDAIRPYLHGEKPDGDVALILTDLDYGELHTSATFICGLFERKASSLSEGEVMQCQQGLTLEELIYVANEVCEDKYEYTDDQDTLTEQLDDLVGFGLDGLENIVNLFVRKGFVTVRQQCPEDCHLHPTLTELREANADLSGIGE